MILIASAQHTFYVVGTIFFIFMMATMMGLLIVLLTIAARFRAMQRKLKNRFNMAAIFATKGKAFVDGFRRGMASKY
jgi:hypothetical protein